MKSQAKAFPPPLSLIQAVAAFWVVVVAVFVTADFAVPVAAFDVVFVVSLVVVVSFVAAAPPQATPVVVVDVALEVARSAVEERDRFVIFRPIFTSIQTLLGAFSVFVTATAADVVVVISCDCVVTFFPGHAFDICHKAPQNHQKGQRPSTTTSILFSRYISIHQLWWVMVTWRTMSPVMMPDLQIKD